VLRKSRPKEKGLRGLSSRAYKAVLQMRNTTYKLVADRLIKELSLNPVLDNRENEETNVKRRVYDALNVLIAVGVIRKDGRAIVSEKGFGGKSRNR
jgi:transcription factor Dp-1/transcription factor Dp-2